MTEKLHIRISTEDFNPEHYPNLELRYPIGVELESCVDNYTTRIKELNIRLNEVATLGYTFGKNQLDHIFHVQYLDDATRAIGDGYSDKRYNILFMKIENVGFNKSLIWSLKKEGIETIEDIKKYSEEDLLKIQKIGRKSINRINDILEGLGLDRLKIR